MRYFYLFWWNCGFKRQKFFCQVRTFPSHDTLCRLLGIRDNLPAFNTWQIYSLSLDLSQDVINLRGIPNDFAVRCLRNLLIVAPTRDNNRRVFGTRLFFISQSSAGLRAMFFDVRYMDDFVILSEDKSQLQLCKKAIEDYVKTLKLSLNQIKGD